MKEKIVVVCPGRGTYTATELGYLKRARAGALVAGVDAYRTAHGQPTVTELDQATRFSPDLQGSPEHAPALIYTCAMADFLSLDPDKSEVVCVVGNSMGWYIALAAAGVLDLDAAIHLVSTMGHLTGEIVGGQLIYPIVDDEWRQDAKSALVERAMAEVNASGDARVFDSIRLGGFRVIAGNEPGIRSLLSKLPPLDDRYPMKLANHAPFHTALMESASQRGLSALPLEMFSRPTVPIVDGDGHVWQPWSTDLSRLRAYTLGPQVTTPYDFTRSLEVALREFAPTRIALLGPGSTLGGAIGQTLVKMKWRGIGSKSDFTALQKRDPFLIAMGRDDQRALVT